MTEMTSTLRRALISAEFARRDTDENFGPASELDGSDLAWRRDSLRSTYLDYRDTRVMGVGADWRQALQDAADTGRLDLTEHGGDLEVARDNLLHGAIWEFQPTDHGVAILDTSAA
ncbi:hypothetical protein [Streptomyces tendae]|uniref:hypothetical protein n=1 Tax=Streptomyces tendae TaxID=1932 RepID=UPI003EB834A2